MARLTHYLMASEWRAAMIASLLLFLPLLSWAGPSIVALHVLCRGAKKSRLVIIFPLLVALVMAWEFADPAMLLVLIITGVLSTVLSRTSSWVTVLMVSLIISLGLVFLVGALYEETLSGLVIVIKQAVTTPEQLSALGIDGQTIDAWMASISIGAMSFVHMVSALFALSVARAMQAIAFNPGGFKAEFSTVILPSAFASGCLILAATGFLIDPWMLRFTPVGLLPLILSGIALVHGLTGMRVERAFNHVLRGISIFYAISPTIIGVIGSY